MTRGAESLIDRATGEAAGRAAGAAAGMTAKPASRGRASGAAGMPAKPVSRRMPSGVTSAMLYPIAKTLTAQGYDPERFFAAANFDGALMRQPDARIPESEFERLMYAASGYTGDDYFGLRQGRLTEPADLGILGYVMMHSGTIRAALEAYRRYNDIVCSGFHLEGDAAGGELTIRMSIGRPDGSGSGGSRHCSEDMASSLYHLIGRMSGRPIPLREAAFSHPAPDPYDPAPYRETFGIEPRFGAEHNLLRMSEDVLDYPIMYADPRLLDVFARIAEETLDRLGNAGAFARKVSQWMMERLPVSYPTLSQAAAAFLMSERSLQHRLKEEGTTFNALSAEVRKELAIRYLREGRYSTADIAYLLHFSEPSAFQNAFKRWTGMTPGQYRV